MTLPLVCGHSGAGGITACYCTDIVLLRIISNLIVQLHRISSCIPFNLVQVHKCITNSSNIILRPDESTMEKKNYSCLCVY